MAVTQLFSQRLGYAVHTLCYMAKKPAGALTTAPELTAWMQEFWPTTSETYLTSVVQRLVRGGLLRSHRGKAGGYSLARSAAEITMRDIVVLLEGIHSPQCHLAPDGMCPADMGCGLLCRLKELEESYLTMLAGVSITELSGVMGAGVVNKARGQGDVGVVADQNLPVSEESSHERSEIPT